MVVDEVEEFVVVIDVFIVDKDLWYGMNWLIDFFCDVGFVQIFCYDVDSGVCLVFGFIQVFCLDIEIVIGVVVNCYMIYRDFLKCVCD